jgi:hypothetical protein
MKIGKSFLLLFFKKEALSFFEKKETKKLYPLASQRRQHRETAR